MASTPGCLLLSPNLKFLAIGPGGDDAFTASAIARALRVVSTVSSRGESVGSCDVSTAGSLSSLSVFVGSSRSNNALPRLGDDETYALHLDSGSASIINASTVWGALRGLETLTQLVSSAGPASGDARSFVPAGSVDIADAPRFAHRGLMIDTGRGFLPPSLITATLDAMAYVKLNVLHWHISDDQAFPVASVVWPNLTLGAMQAPAQTHVYSHADVVGIVHTAAERGIRVVPEFDVPGHSTSWFAGYPELETVCAPSGEFSAPMDPTKEYTYTFLERLFGEMGATFPDAMFHIGGDEVQFSCWLNNTDIVDWMLAHNVTDGAALQLLFERRVVGLLPAGKQSVIWEGNAGSESAYPPGAIVHAWKERAGDLSVLEGLIRKGFTTLWTTPDWYLDWTYVSASPGANFDSHVNGPAEWQHVHSVDPLRGTTLSPAQQKQLLGAEVCAWSLYEDASNFMAFVFPRTAAVAERLWSAAGPAVDEPTALLERMRALRCRLLARGIGAAPVEQAGSCPNAWVQPYTPPF